MLSVFLDLISIYYIHYHHRLESGSCQRPIRKPLARAVWKRDGIWLCAAWTVDWNSVLATAEAEEIPFSFHSQSIPRAIERLCSSRNPGLKRFLPAVREEFHQPSIYASQQRRSSGMALRFNSEMELLFLREYEERLGD
jgi:hypothetical protein